MGTLQSELEGVVFGLGKVSIGITLELGDVGSNLWLGFVPCPLRCLCRLGALALGGGACSLKIRSCPALTSPSYQDGPSLESRVSRGLWSW